MKASFYFIISLIVLALCSYLLLTGSSLLAKPIIDGVAFPYGTLITWVGLVALPFAIYSGVRRIKRPISFIHKVFSYVYNFFILLSLFWGFVSYYFASNWTFIFTQKSEFRGSIKASEYFWAYTVACIALPLMFLFLYWFYLLICYLRAKTK